MSNEEVKEIEEKECKCGCEFCKCVKKILGIAVACFIGFYCALTLFFALHRPPMPMPMGPGFNGQPPMMEQGFEHHKMKGMNHHNDIQKPQPPVNEVK